VIFVEGIAGLFIGPHDLFEKVPVDPVLSGLIDALDQLLHIRPAVGIQSDARILGVVPQDPGEKFAGSGALLIFCHRCLPLPAELYRGQFSRKIRLQPPPGCSRQRSSSECPPPSRGVLPAAPPPGRSPHPPSGL
jgi:hypothetical protein